MKMKFRTRFDRLKVGLFCPPEEGMTKPEFKKDCDINVIIAKYRKTGQLPPQAMNAAARFGDFSQIPTFHEMRDRVLAAEDLFAQLPAKVREAFGNDPGEFIAASTTKEGHELYRELGLLPKPSSTASEAVGAGQAPKAGTEPAAAPSVPKEENK